MRNKLDNSFLMFDNVRIRFVLKEIETKLYFHEKKNVDTKFIGVAASIDIT